MNICGEHSIATTDDEIAYSDDKCPACEQIEEINKDHNREVEDLKQQIDELEEKLGELNDKQS